MHYAESNQLFAENEHRQKVFEQDPLRFMNQFVDFAALAKEIDQHIPRNNQTAKGGRPAYSTETMIRILIIKRYHGLSLQQTEFQLLDRISFKAFARLTNASNTPDKNTIWEFEQRLGKDGAEVLFEAFNRQLARHGFAARGGQVVDGTLVSVPVQHFTEKDKESLDQGTVPQD